MNKCFKSISILIIAALAAGCSGGGKLESPGFEIGGTGLVSPGPTAAAGLSLRVPIQ